MAVRAELVAHREINRGYLDHIRRWSIGRASGLQDAVRHGVGSALRLASVPFLILLAAALTIVLRVSLLFRGRVKSTLHDNALEYVDVFVEQYPMHLYPIVAKSIELSYLKRQLREIVNPNTSIIEVAIGEGTLSARIFGNEHKLTGLDLNPYSLVKATKQPHVRQAVICDGLNPPVRPGAFDLLLSNNFLHHVTSKEDTVRNWANVAPVVLFNENTPFWASAWTIPYVLRKLGFAQGSARAARKIESESLQHLECIDTLCRQIAPHCEIDDRSSFLSERTFFYCSLFSFFMKCYGPPTPAVVKALLLGVLRPIAVPLTRQCARTLILYDATQERSADTFVTFLCHSKYVRGRSSGDGNLLCPGCRVSLQNDNRCPKCDKTYPTRDGMLFLLPEEFAHVIDDYLSERSASIPDEHL